MYIPCLRYIPASPSIRRAQGNLPPWFQSAWTIRDHHLMGYWFVRRVGGMEMEGRGGTVRRARLRDSSPARFSKNVGFHRKNQQGWFCACPSRHGQPIYLISSMLRLGDFRLTKNLNYCSTKSENDPQT